jgi:hypothetical protein
MKLSCTLSASLAIASALFSQSSTLVNGHLRAKAANKGGNQWTFRIKDTADHGRNLGDEGYGQLYSDAMCVGDTCGDGPICIELKDGNPGDDKKLTIGDCSGPGWRLDGNGLFHSEADDDQCMQAGRHGPPEDGEIIRMFGCDSDNELQKFVYDYSSISPVNDESLCVVWKGSTPNLGVDAIVLKKCDTVFNRSAWSGDLPIEDPSSTIESPPLIDGCTHHEVTVTARAHNDDSSTDPDIVLRTGSVDEVFVTQVESTDALFDGYDTLGYIKCNAASYLEFPSMPGFNDDEEWGITCTAILLNRDKSDGSVSQLVATGLAGGLFKKLENSPFSDVGMPIVGGSGPFQGAVGTIAVSIADPLDEDDGCDVGSCDALTWKIKLCGV